MTQLKSVSCNYKEETGSNDKKLLFDLDAGFNTRLYQLSKKKFTLFYESRCLTSVLQVMKIVK